MHYIEREREREQKYKINEEKKGLKKKNNIWNKKRVKSAHTHTKNRTSEKKESGKFFLDKVRVNVCCTGQFGISKWDFFLHFIYSSSWGDCNLVGQGRKPLDPNFPSHFFLLPNTPKYYFFLLFFSIILKIHPTKQTSLEKSSISLY